MSKTLMGCVLPVVLKIQKRPEAPKVFWPLNLMLIKSRMSDNPISSRVQDYATYFSFRQLVWLKSALLFGSKLDVLAFGVLKPVLW